MDDGRVIVKHISYICYVNGNDMKKAFFKLMLVVLGLNVFTACYGPAPGWTDEDPELQEQTTDETKAADEEAQGAEESAQEGEKAE